jgi:hypothetical protein
VAPRLGVPRLRVHLFLAVEAAGLLVTSIRSIGFVACGVGFFSPSSCAHLLVREVLQKVAEGWVLGQGGEGAHRALEEGGVVRQGSAVLGAAPSRGGRGGGVGGARKAERDRRSKAG